MILIGERINGMFKVVKEAIAAKDKKAIQELSTEEGIEKLAREKYYMKRDSEEIYIIEYEDSIKNQKKND